MMVLGVPGGEIRANMFSTTFAAFPENDWNYNVGGTWVGDTFYLHEQRSYVMGSLWGSFTPDQDNTSESESWMARTWKLTPEGWELVVGGWDALPKNMAYGDVGAVPDGYGTETTWSTEDEPIGSFCSDGTYIYYTNLNDHSIRRLNTETNVLDTIIGQHVLNPDAESYNSNSMADGAAFGPSMPRYRSMTAFAEGTGGIAVGWPTDVAGGDILLLHVETHPTDTSPPVSIPSDWTHIATARSGSDGGSIRTEASVYWHRYDGENQPSLSIPDQGDHVMAGITVWEGCVETGSPVHAYQTSFEATADQTLEAPGPTTTIDNCVIVATATMGDRASWSSYANTTLDNYQRYGTTDASNPYVGFDYHYQGNDGAIIVLAGALYEAGSSGTFTANTSESEQDAVVVVALVPGDGTLASTGDWPYGPAYADGWVYFWDQKPGTPSVKALRRVLAASPHTVETVISDADHPWGPIAGWTAAQKEAGRAIDPATGAPYVFDPTDVTFSSDQGQSDQGQLFHHEGYLYWVENVTDYNYTDEYWYRPSALRRMALGSTGLADGGFERQIASVGGGPNGNEVPLGYSGWSNQLKWSDLSDIEESWGVYTGYDPTEIRAKWEFATANPETGSYHLRSYAQHDPGQNWKPNNLWFYNTPYPVSPGAHAGYVHAVTPGDTVQVGMSGMISENYYAGADVSVRMNMHWYEADGTSIGTWTNGWNPPDWNLTGEYQQWAQTAFQVPDTIPTTSKVPAFVTLVLTWAVPDNGSSSMMTIDIDNVWFSKSGGSNEIETLYWDGQDIEPVGPFDDSRLHINVDQVVTIGDYQTSGHPAYGRALDPDWQPDIYYHRFWFFQNAAPGVVIHDGYLYAQPWHLGFTDDGLAPSMSWRLVRFKLDDLLAAAPLEHDPYYPAFEYVVNEYPPAEHDKWWGRTELTNEGFNPHMYYAPFLGGVLLGPDGVYVVHLVNWYQSLSYPYGAILISRLTDSVTSAATATIQLSFEGQTVQGPGSGQRTYTMGPVQLS